MGYQRTKQRLLEIAASRSITEKQLTSLLKGSDYVPFHEKHWDMYMLLITLHPGCPICGGEQRYVHPWNWLAGVKQNQQLVCKLHHSHTVHIGILNTLVHWKKYASFEEALAAIPLCPHDHVYTFECDECVTSV